MFEYVSADGAEEFDRFVRESPDGHFMQTSLWGRVKSDWSWTGILLREESGKAVGSIALLGRRGRKCGARILYAPRGPVWPRERPEILRLLLEEAVRCAKREGACLLRVDPDVEEGDRPFLRMMRSCRFRRRVRDDYTLFQPRLSYGNDLGGVSPETLEEKYHRSTRRNLHLAEKNGVRVVRAGEEAIGEFMRLMTLTGERDGFVPRGEEYYRRILRELGPYAVLYAAKEGEKTVAAGIAVHFGVQSSYLYGCSDEEGKRLRANDLLLHRIQQDALRQGCRFFDFRGVEGFPTEDNPHFGLHRFKKGFGAFFRIAAGEFDRILRPGGALLLRLAEQISRLRRRWKTKRRPRGESGRKKLA